LKVFPKETIASRVEGELEKRGKPREEEKSGRQAVHHKKGKKEKIRQFQVYQERYRGTTKKRKGRKDANKVDVNTGWVLVSYKENL